MYVCSCHGKILAAGPGKVLAAGICPGKVLAVANCYRKVLAARICPGNM